MYKRGECPPLLVVFDSCEGFTVEADGHRKDMTFITEYTDDVDYIKNREHDDCDSMMTLLLATDPSNSLLICPNKRGNIACFINGINNHTSEGKKKQNLKCVRYRVNGECRVFLVATRDIAKVSEKLLDERELEFHKWDRDAAELLKGVQEKLNVLGEVNPYNRLALFMFDLCIGCV
ncbi:hypothetical protein F0562_001471 [Nyssa sinensis]|uniref:SET domain-containing protein n=1 Tax=Nyssa sinensis TaxID=561372 RepID=A0A5J5C7A9_9ASTE|nr:hypothetical protein F0562_001471 [Nyssa sinensis]